MQVARDPVCGVMVDEKTASYKTIYANKVYYFDSIVCVKEFNKNPAKYLRKEDALHSHHASHYGGYCGTSGCGPPARGTAWYLYVGLLSFLLITLLLTVLLTR